MDKEKEQRDEEEHRKGCEDECPDSTPIAIPITEVLDLHTFQPKEVKDLVENYLEECHKRGFLEVRIIHGKGTGTLRTIVHAVLKRSALVSSFHLAPLEAGSWGATMVKLIKG